VIQPDNAGSTLKQPRRPVSSHSTHRFVVGELNLSEIVVVRRHSRIDLPFQAAPTGRGDFQVPGRCSCIQRQVPEGGSCAMPGVWY
jgi:hypothetical protein